MCLTTLLAGMSFVLAHLLHTLSQLMQVCSIGSPECIYRGLEFNSCSTIAIMVKLNLERTNSMIWVWWTDESGEDELVDESKVLLSWGWYLMPRWDQIVWQADLPVARRQPKDLQCVNTSWGVHIWKVNCTTVWWFSARIQPWVTVDKCVGSVDKQLCLHWFVLEGHGGQQIQEKNTCVLVENQISSAFQKMWKLMVFVCAVGTLNVQFLVYLRVVQEEMRWVWILKRTSRGWGTIVGENIW